MFRGLSTELKTEPGMVGNSYLILDSETALVFKVKKHLAPKDS